MDGIRKFSKILASVEKNSSSCYLSKLWDYCIHMDSENLYKHLSFGSLSFEFEDLCVGTVFGNSMSNILARVCRCCSS